MKKYFNTPKMPLSFYITDLTIYHLLILSLMYFSSSGDENKFGNLVFLLLYLGFIALQSYTWAWFCDFMLFNSGDNALIQFMFRPFGISKRMAATAAMVSFVTNREYKIDNYKVVRDYSSNFRSLGCMALLFLLPRLALSTAIAPWTILFHMVTIKKYKEAVQQEIE